LEFDKNIYTLSISEADIQEELISLIGSIKDDLTTVLRIHLLCERHLEAFICASVNNVNLFRRPCEISMTFSLKLKIARNLGLSKTVHDSIYLINKIRNDFAHNLMIKKISEKTIEDLYERINKIENLIINPDQISLTGDYNITYSVTSSSTPNRIKLVILYFCLSLSIIKIEHKDSTSDNGDVPQEKKTMVITLRKKNG
jgi:hypothetical protein